MTDTPAPQDPAPARAGQWNAVQRDDPPRSEPATPSAESESPGKTSGIGLSVSTNAALGFVGVLVTLFGSAIIGLLLYTLNNLSDRITTTDTKIAVVEADLSDRITAVSDQLAGLSQRQADMDKTLSVLVAILNARSEVDAAKAHQVTALD